MTRFQIIRHLIRANGLYWFSLYILERAFGNFTSFFQQERYSREVSHRLPGFNTILYNHKEWRDYDWSKGGEEWSDSQAWKQSLISEVMLKYIMPDKVVLEIGPGGGRWSETLASVSRKLVLVDLTEKSI